MINLKAILSLSVIALNLVKDVTGASYSVTVSSTSKNAIPSTLFGQMFEDISHSGDGGLYGELLQNRALQLTSSISPWAAYGGSSVSLSTSGGPSSQLPQSLAVKVTGSGQGVSNTGYWGINVQASSSYNASFYVKSSNSAAHTVSLTVALQSSSGSTLGSTTVSQSISGSWVYVDAIITTSASPSDTNNKFVLTVSGAASGETVYLGMLSLFPEATFKNRVNGMRNDVASALASMTPRIWRFPGGNNIEGGSASSRWIWNNTIGPLVNRPGRNGDWGYVNTDGIGLMEYLNWCEDVGMLPIMAVWAGYSLDGNSIAQGSLGPYVQTAIDQINFVMGDASTNQYAALRAKYGHPAPYNLQWVEIGNEDFFASSTYTYRWTAFANAIQSAFPNLGIIATSYLNNPVLSPNPKFWDLHYYQTPDWFVQNAFMYDSYARNGVKFFIGEYAVTATNSSCLFGSTSCGRLEYPTMQGSSAEAAFMCGLERNSDIIFAASYAPLAGNTNNLAWTPNLIYFNAGTTVKTTSFYVQQLFSTYLGDTLLTHTLPTSGNSVQWSVSHSSSKNELYIKVVNAGSSSSSVAFSISGYTIGSATLYSLGTGSATASNTITNTNAVSVASSSFSASSSFTLNINAYTVQVLVISTSGSTGTTVKTTTTTSTASGACQSLYGQCGGIGFTGPTCCVSSTCTVGNPYYSQCLS